MNAKVLISVVAGAFLLAGCDQGSESEDVRAPEPTQEASTAAVDVELPVKEDFEVQVQEGIDEDNLEDTVESLASDISEDES